ncbi:MAG: hypothetical protein R3E97_19980 [Candidatus Eisenbacteria bacterium]
MNRFVAMAWAILLGSAGAAAANSGQDCSDPILLNEMPEYFVFGLDTTEWENSIEREASCFEGVTSGPDVVLQVLGEVAGEVIWTADFDAVVYVVADSCMAACDNGGSGTSGWATFDTGYSGPDGTGHTHYRSPYIVVDGIDGAAGTIVLQVYWGYHNPTVEMSWGQAKSIFLAPGTVSEENR